MNLESETLILEQKISELQNNKTLLINSLSELIGAKLSPDTDFKIPNPKNYEKRKRLEYTLFKAEKSLLKTQESLLNSRYIPKLTAFTQIGYGKPGLNFFETDFNKFAVVGLNLSWQLWDWKITSNEKKILHLQKTLLEREKTTFSKAHNIEKYESLTKINNLEELLEKDRQIINLKFKIEKLSAEQLATGVITPNEYLANVNAKIKAEEDLNIHEIELLFENINFNTIVGE